MNKKILSMLELKRNAGLEVCLDLGCGDQKRTTNHLGVDAIGYQGVDFVGDVFEILSFFPAESVDKIYASHFIEHVEDLTKLLDAIDRCLKPGGDVEFVAPHFSNPYFYSDPTHKNFFGLYTFCYFFKSKIFARQGPVYSFDYGLELTFVSLVFKSPKPFYLRYGLKKVFGVIFNSNNFFRELYEEWFCYLIPCYEVVYRIKKIEG